MDKDFSMAVATVVVGGLIVWAIDKIAGQKIANQLPKL